MTKAYQLLAKTFLSFSLLTSVAHAEGEVLLTVTHGESVIEYDQDGLDRLGTVTVETSTIWTDGVSSFTGVPLRNLAETLEVTEGVFLASAINDYTVEIPMSDAVEGGAVIAFLKDGEPMSVRDKGPLWVVYPYDDNPDYQSEVTYSRSIWQLDRIETSE